MRSVDEPTREMPAVRPSRPPGRRPVRRLVVWALMLAALAVLVALGAAWYGSLRIPSTEIPSLDAAGIGAETYLVVGSDSRENLPEDLEGQFGGGGGQRADVIMLVRISGARAQLLSIPRDLRVEIPGRGTDKINAAFAYGGGDLTVQTVRGATGLPIHRYLEVDFAGFARIVDALGGVDLHFVHAARDEKSGLAVEAGTERIDGPTALAYVRSRQYQEHRDGRWVSVDADDLGRTGRQQRLVFAMLAEAKQPAGLLRLPVLVEAARRSMVTDSGLGVVSMLRVGWQVPFLDADDVEAATLPVRPVSEGGISYVIPVEPEASAVLEAFRRGESMIVAAEGPPTVRVLNGNGVPGAAGEVAELLAAEGFPVAGTGDAERHDYPRSLVIAPPEERARARLVAERLGFGEVQVGEVGAGADVLIIVGLDRA